MLINSALCVSAAFMAAVVCFDVLEFDPKTTTPPITSAIAPIAAVGSNRIAPIKLANIQNSTGSDDHLRKQHGLAAPIKAFGKFVDIGFEAGDLIAQVIIGHTRGLPLRLSQFRIAHFPDRLSDKGF